MAVPTLEKTWQIDTNNVIASATELTFNQNLLFAIKQAFLAFGTLPWTVKGSSDSSIAALDAVDRWVAATDLIWASGVNAHSWIVFGQGAGGGELCLDLNFSNTSSDQLEGRWSASAGFTGGSITARPTATDEIDIDIGTANNWAGGQEGTPIQNVFHVWHSTDGLVDRVMICAGGLAHTFWRFEKIKNPRTAHTNNPTGVSIWSDTFIPAEPSLTDILSTSGVLNTEKDGSGTKYILRATVQTYGSSGILPDSASGGVAEEWDDELWALEEHFFNTEVGSRGPKGSSYDLWFGQYQIMVTGDTFPDNASAREFAAFGPWILPWTGDAVIPQVS